MIEDIGVRTKKVEARISEMPVSERKTRNIMIGKEMYTPEEILNHIKRRTEIGMMFIEAGST